VQAYFIIDCTSVTKCQLSSGIAKAKAKYIENQWCGLSHPTSKRTYKISHQEPEPPPLPVWAVPGVDLNDPSLLVTQKDGYSKMDFLPNVCERQLCKDPRCQYLAADKWEFCCGKCQYYYETYGLQLGRPTKKHCNRCWRVYIA
jgi:hypothetical protein